MSLAYKQTSLENETAVALTLMSSIGFTYNSVYHVYFFKQIQLNIICNWEYFVRRQICKRMVPIAHLSYDFELHYQTPVNQG